MSGVAVYTGDELYFGISAMRYLNSQDIYIQGRV